GVYDLNGNDVANMDEETLSEVRNREIGFIFQQFQLLPRLSALDNVELPLIYAGVPEKERKQRARAMLEKVGLGTKLKNKPNQLSGGQQQRVAIARALVTQPTILLADEPTGALDQKTGVQIMDLFQELHAEGKTIVMITHDEKIAQHGSRIVKILDGSLSEQPHRV
ncbi:MAG: ABC transporter ATP-binding protein, partial [Culicoidibacterales bacterium]